eukprot:COSAG04_NODE_123_length_24709_cov_113.457294_14_plen_57_part_00
MVPVVGHHDVRRRILSCYLIAIRSCNSRTRFVFKREQRRRCRFFGLFSAHIQQFAQ